MSTRKFETVQSELMATTSLHAMVGTLTAHVMCLDAYASALPSADGSRAVKGTTQTMLSLLAGCGESLRETIMKLNAEWTPSLVVHINDTGDVNE